MEPTPPPKLKLGDTLDGTVLNSVGGRRFALRCSGVPRGWKVELQTRRPELIEDGATVSTWVAKIAPLQGQILVHDGPYGRLPVSDAMRPRYIAALRALLGETEITTENMADARSMVLSIVKQRNADWLSIWRLLSEPHAGEVKILLAAIDSLRAARKEDPDAIPAVREKLNEEYGPILQAALGRLERMAKFAEKRDA